MKIKENANILFYDIETILLLFYAFATGEQRLTHKQLLAGKSRYGIICISYCWGKGPIKTINWTAEGGFEQLIFEFDQIIKKADHVIGKNSNSFDNKMVNGCRIFTSLPGLPDWIRYTDDLEKQMRKYFKLPSMSLDYISNQFGLGGKIKMDFDDWVLVDQWMTIKTLEYKGMTSENLDIYCNYMYNKSLLNVLKDGLKAFKKFGYYNRKDVSDTRAIWYKLEKHFEPKFNQATFYDIGNGCKQCGSRDLVMDGTAVQGNTKYQRYECRSCGRYAGRSLYSQGTKGKVR